MRAADRDPVVVIGIGNTMRRDDGIGPLALEALRGESFPSCDLVELDGETTRVIEAWRDRDLAIVVDAVCAGAAPGTLHDLTLEDLDDLNLLAGIGAGTGATSSHAAGLAEALALGRSLDRLPRKLRVIGIEPGDVSHGHGMSPAVSATMAGLVTRVGDAIVGVVDGVAP